MKTTPLTRVAFCLTLICFSVLPLSAADHFVNVYSSSYSPNYLQIAPGDNVYWVNQDDFSHTVTSANNSWQRGYLFDYQDVFGLNFPFVATYSYFDEFDGFTGTIEVASGGTPPANDQCSGATVMTPGTLYTTNTAGATATGDPTTACSAPLGKGVWYTLTPASSGQIIISTCSSDFDTVLSVYTGTCGALTAVPGGCNDDSGPACLTTKASLTLSATAGTTYRILAAGWGGESGILRIIATAPAPANDLCSGAIAMTAGTLYSMNTSTATSTGDPLPSCASGAGKGVWYTFTSAEGGLTTVSTCGSDFDTALAIYTGTCGSLIAVSGGCSDDNGPACSGVAGSLAFTASPGVTYRIFAAGYTAGSGNLKILATTSAPASSWQEASVAFDIGVSIARPDTNLIHFVDQTNDRLLTLNTDTGAFISSIRLHGKLASSGLMCFSLDGQFLYLPLDAVKKLQVISLATLSTVDVIPLTVSPTSIAAGSDGKLYAMANGQLTKIDPATGQTLGALPWSFYSPIMKANASGTRLFIMELGLSGGGSMIDEYAVVPSALPTYVTNHFSGKSNDKDFVIAEDIGRLYSTSGGVYGVGMWDMTNRTYSFWPYDAPYGVGVAMVPNDSFVYGCSYGPSDPRIRRFNRLTGAVSNTFDINAAGRGSGAAYDRSIKVTPNGRIFYAREFRKIGLIGASALNTNIQVTAEIIDAGTNRTVIAGETFNLTAIAPLPSAGDSYSWRKISGPGAVTFSPSNSLSTTVQVGPGTYSLEIIRSNDVWVSRDQILVTGIMRLDPLGRTIDGRFQMRLRSGPGSFLIEASTNLSQWDPMTNVFSTEAEMTITDPQTNRPYRFYRTRLVPN